MKTIYLLVKNGDKTYFNRAGVAFTPNKDGSVNSSSTCSPTSLSRCRDDEKDS